LRAAVAMVAIFAGLQLVWSGAHTLAQRHAPSMAKIVAHARVANAR